MSRMPNPSDFKAALAAVHIAIRNRLEGTLISILVVAEKPSVAMSYAKVLGATSRQDGYLEGNGYLVSWCVGHLVELAPPNVYDAKYVKWSIADLPILPQKWQYLVSASTKKQFGILQKLMHRSDVDSIVNSCDSGREGELIFRLVYQQAGCKKPFFRLWLSSMEESAIREGFAHLKPSTEYDALYNAALCRERADWMVGINASRLFSCLYNQPLAVGRVMTPVLAMTVVREAAIAAFTPEKFYTVALTLADGGTASSKRFAQKADAELLLSKCRKEGRVTVQKIRLPNNAFKANASTEVVSDILFLQKRDRPADIEPAWVQLGQTEDGFNINQYFVDHPEMVLGNLELESTQYGHDLTVAPIEDANLADQLTEAVQHIEGQYTAVEIAAPDVADAEVQRKTLPADPTVKNFSYTVVDGEIYYRENSIMTQIELSDNAKGRVAGMVELRQIVNELIDQQLNDFPDEDIKASQAKLNYAYDAFTAKYGLINDKKNARLFDDDSSYYLLCSLENLDENKNLKSKADMFTKRTIRPERVVTSVDTPSEALAVSIGEHGKVDLPYMAELLGTPGNYERITTESSRYRPSTSALLHTRWKNEESKHFSEISTGIFEPLTA